MRSYYKDLRVDYMDGHEKMNTDRKNRHMVSKYFQMKMHVEKNPSIYLCTHDISRLRT